MSPAAQRQIKSKMLERERKLRGNVQEWEKKKKSPKWPVELKNSGADAAGRKKELGPKMSAMMTAKERAFWSHNAYNLADMYMIIMKDKM